MHNLTWIFQDSPTGLQPCRNTQHRREVEALFPYLTWEKHEGTFSAVGQLLLHFIFSNVLFLSAAHGLRQPFTSPADDKRTDIYAHTHTFFIDFVLIRDSWFFGFQSPLIVRFFTSARLSALAGSIMPRWSRQVLNPSSECLAGTRRNKSIQFKRSRCCRGDIISQIVPRHNMFPMRRNVMFWYSEHT